MDLDNLHTLFIKAIYIISLELTEYEKENQSKNTVYNSIYKGISIAF